MNTGLSWENFKWAFSQTESGHWHPLTWLSHQLDCQVFGLNPAYHHLENILWHTLNTLLVFWILIKLFADWKTAWLISALFALHPLRIESVAWVTERKDVLSVFFGLLTILTYLYFRAKQNWRRYLLLITFFILGLLAKPSLVILPCLLLLLDYWPLKLKKYFLEKIPLFVISLLFALATLWGQNKIGALKDLSSLTLLDRFSIACVGYLSYIEKTFLPTGLSIFYPLVKYPPTFGIAACTILLGITILMFRYRQRFPYLIVSWAWFLIALLPVIGFVQVGWQAFALRWTYLPHVGLAIALCGAVSTMKVAQKKWIYLTLGILIVLVTIKTSIELKHWQNSETLFSHALDVNPDNFLAHTNLGVALSKRGDKDSAMTHYEEAVRLNPTYPEALNNLGNLKAQKGFLEEAKSLFERALTRDPNMISAKYNLGLLHYNTGEKMQAVIQWSEILKMNPEYQPAINSLNYAAKEGILPP